MGIPIFFIYDEYSIGRLSLEQNPLQISFLIILTYFYISIFWNTNILNPLATDSNLKLRGSSKKRYVDNYFDSIFQTFFLIIGWYNKFEKKFVSATQIYLKIFIKEYYFPELHDFGIFFHSECYFMMIFGLESIIILKFIQFFWNLVHFECTFIFLKLTV